MPSPISKPTNRDGREARKALCWNDAYQEGENDETH